MVKERRSEKELRQMMLAAARNHEECSELEDLFIFGPMPRSDANWGFGIAGKDNKVSVACYTRLDQIANDLQTKYELHPVKAARREIEARVWSLIHDHPTLKSSLLRAGGAYEFTAFNGSSGRFKRKLSWNRRFSVPTALTCLEERARNRRQDPKGHTQQISDRDMDKAQRRLSRIAKGLRTRSYSPLARTHG